MNSLLIKKLTVTALAGLFFSILAGARTVGARYQITPEVEQAIGEIKATQSNAEMLQVLTAIQDRSEQATQVILASMSVFDLEQRNEILHMLFELPRAEKGVNASHIPLLAQLYVKAVQAPPMSLSLAQRRSFIQNSILISRLLATFAHLLHADGIKVIRARETPLPTLLKLFEGSRGSNSLSVEDHQMVEDAIIVVKKGIEEDDGLKKITPMPATTTTNSTLVQPLATAKTAEAKPTASPPLNELLTSTPWSYIILLVTVAIGLLSWHKSHK